MAMTIDIDVLTYNKLHYKGAFLYGH
ncbi:uncharacterized protein G2W53_031832 [Senna tora]|uniref:Uncharacterized protein n=1 Tax=Senna tora TaxID=362788 RepID=A0A834SXV4_9FABA|nr:uncharacterized protein G2W53_031832 [Senna tora]